MKELEHIIFHVDVNSAYLSWSSVYNLQRGGSVDYRLIPSIVGGDRESRHGIVLAKSTPAKKYKIITGEPIYNALSKCPNLEIIKPDHALYSKCSLAMVELLYEYSPIIERYSIDECFIDMGYITKTEAIKIAYEIKDRIYRELGFTVNVGIGTNKLCAKMASDFLKPNKVHTLYKEEIKSKLWPLPVNDLFMVGPSFAKKLKDINIRTIGDIAKGDRNFFEENFGKHGAMIYNFSHGVDNSPVYREGSIEAKGIGNSTTLPRDAMDFDTCFNVITSLLNTTLERLKESGKLTSCVSVSYTNSSFVTKRKQKTFSNPTDSFTFILAQCKSLFKEIYINDPVRKLAVSVTSLSSSNTRQLSFLDFEKAEKEEAISKVMDVINNKYGEHSLLKANLINGKLEKYRSK